MSPRTWFSIITFALIAIILFFTREELVKAWELLSQVNIWILLLLIPGQALVYLAAGEMVFSYLRAKNAIGHVKTGELVRMSLEMNFVNHILPSGGVSGVSYMGWRLSKFGVNAGRATMAQVVRLVSSFAAFSVLLVIAVLLVTIDGDINRWVILVSSTLVSLTVGSVVGSIYLLGSKRRMERFGGWIVRAGNRLIRTVTFGRKKTLLQRDKVLAFMNDMHDDYLELRRDKKILIKPFLWGLVYTLADVGLFVITFLALGQPINPAPILIAYGAAALVSTFVATPGGAGAYEAVMVTFLALAGISQGSAIAGILLTRIILLLGTIAFGYIFYQHSLVKYGKSRRQRLEEKPHAHDADFER